MKKRFYQLGKQVLSLSAVIAGTLLFSNQVSAQGVSINGTGTGTAPDASAILDLNVSGITPKKGFLAPRVALTGSGDATTITSPATSLIVYNTATGGGVSPGFYYNSGTPGAPSWVSIGGSGSAPTAGNDIDVTGTVVDIEPILDFVHTINGASSNPLTLNAPLFNDLIFQTSGTERARLTSAGNFGIGDANPASLFTVGSGDLFQVNSSGNLIAINGLTGYSWPAVHASGVLRNNGTGTLTWGAPTISGAAALPNGQIWIGDGSGIAQPQTMSGDATISNTGALTLATVATAGTSTKVTYNAKGLVTSGTAAVLASADFANQGTTTNVLHGNAAGNPSWGAVTGADFGNQVANTVFSGPASGANAIPTFRTMVPLDLATGPVNGEVLGVTGGVLDWVPTLTNPMTTAGDMIYAPVSGTPAAAVRFPAGTNGNVLHTTGGLPSWSALNMAGGVNEVTGILPVGNGGTGVANPTSGSLLIGAGASAMTPLAGAANYTIYHNGTTWTTNSNATTGLFSNGTSVGIGVAPVLPASGGALLDIHGINDGTIPVSLQLRNGDSQNLPTDGAQISFSYSGTPNFRHNIRTRHNSAPGTANAIDFYLWKPGVDANGALGSNRVFTIFNDGTNSGVELYGGLFTNASWGTAGQVLVSGGTGVAPTWTTAASGTVTSVSVVSANGLAGTVATPSTTPAITLSTTQTGLLTGNGTAIIGNTGTQYGLPYWATASTVGTTNAGTATQVLHGNASGAPSFSAIANGDLPGSGAITMSYGTGVSGSASVALGGTLTLNNTGVTSIVAGTGISISGGTGDVTITNSDPDQIVGNEITNATSATSGLVRSGAGTGVSPYTLGLDYSSVIGSDPALAANQTLFGSTGVIFEGATANTFEGLLTSSDVTADRTWTLPDASGTIALTTNLPVAANPSVNVTLTTQNGTATTFMRSDAAPALDQTIAPTWTGIHTFTNATPIRITNGLVGAPSIAFSGSTTTGIYTPTNGELAVTASGVQGMRVTNLGVGVMGGTPTATNALVVTGKVKSTGINETSDVRLKMNFASIDGALSKVLSMNGKYYDWRTTEFPNRGLEEGRQVGVIAQEIENILPEVVVTDDDGFKSVEYGHIVPVLIEAIKEQQKIIDGQKSTICDLKASLENVLNRVNIIEKNSDLNSSKVEK